MLVSTITFHYIIVVSDNRNQFLTRTPQKKIWCTFPDDVSSLSHGNPNIYTVFNRNIWRLMLKSVKMFKSYWLHYKSMFILGCAAQSDCPLGLICRHSLCVQGRWNNLYCILVSDKGISNTIVHYFFFIIKSIATLFLNCRLCGYRMSGTLRLHKKSWIL